MKILIYIVVLLFPILSFSQARKLLGQDTANNFGGKIYIDTIKSLQSNDGSITFSNPTPYIINAVINSSALNQYWTKQSNSSYPNRIYVGHDINPYKFVGIGTDTAMFHLHLIDSMPANTIIDSVGLMLQNKFPGITANSSNSYYAPSIYMVGYGATGFGSFLSGIMQSMQPIYQASTAVPPNVSLVWYSPSIATTNIHTLFSSPTQIMKLSTSGLGGGSPIGMLNIGGLILGDNATAGQIGNGGSSYTVSLVNANGNGGIKIQGATNTWTSRAAFNTMYFPTNLSLNDSSSTRVADTAAILDISSRTKGLLIPRMTSNKVDSITSAIYNGTGGMTLTNGGSGYTGTTGLYALTGGSGSGAIFLLTISGNAVTSLNLGNNNKGGTGYKVGDILSATITGGSGFQATVAKVGLNGAVNGVSAGMIVYDSTYNNVRVHTNAGYNSWTGRQTTSSASTLTLDYGDDYYFNGTTSTYTLPSVASNISGRQNEILIINLGSGSITLNSGTGSQIIPTASTTAQASLTITTGQSVELLPTGTAFKVLIQN